MQFMRLCNPKDPVKPVDLSSAAQTVPAVPKMAGESKSLVNGWDAQVLESPLLDSHLENHSITLTSTCIPVTFACQENGYRFKFSYLLLSLCEIPLSSRKFRLCSKSLGSSPPDRTSDRRRHGRGPCGPESSGTYGRILVLPIPLAILIPIFFLTAPGRIRDFLQQKRTTKRHGPTAWEPCLFLFSLKPVRIQGKGPLLFSIVPASVLSSGMRGSAL